MSARATLLFVMWLLPAAAAAQQDSLPSGLREDVAVALRAEIRRAESAGLPSDALVLKVYEGRSKGASDEQILQAVIALRERLEVAASVLGTAQGGDVLLAAAGALHAGVDRAMLRQLAETTDGQALDIALVVVGDLIRRGVPMMTATRAVLSMRKAGADGVMLSEFRRNVDDDIRTGVTPARAAEVRMRGVLTRIGGPGGER